jgi:hypothetical protein
MLGESGNFDPELYRPQIMRIERLVQKQQADRGDGDTLYKYAVELAQEMGKDIGSDVAKEMIMKRCLSFGEHFSRQEERGPIDMAEARVMWKDLRTKLFKPADWFQ